MADLIDRQMPEEFRKLLKDMGFSDEDVTWCRDCKYSDMENELCLRLDGRAETISLNGWCTAGMPREEENDE